MTRRAKVIVSTVFVLIALSVIAWSNRLDIMLALIEFQQQRAIDIGPTQEIVWDRGADPRGRPTEERPPNIVVIMADDLGWNDLSWLGGGVAGGSVPTPNIDSLARDGAQFRNGYAANGTCAPSRAALMTGRYATRFGFEFTPTPAGMISTVARLGNQQPGRLRESTLVEGPTSMAYDDMGMPPSEITIAEMLQQADYHTVHIGKWHLGRNGGMAPHDQGFDESLLMVSGLYLPEDDPRVVNSKQDFDPIDQFLWRAMSYAASWNGGPAFEPDGYLTDYYTDQAVSAIEANRERPFFLYLAHWSVHTPLQALREDYDALAHIDDHRLRVYAAMVRSLDRSVGRVLQALSDSGLEENTLVFFTSDNGAPAYIGLPRVNEPFRGWKITFFEGGIHVPYFIKWPARIPSGLVFDAPVHGFDIFSTAASAAGVALPGDRAIDGKDLVPYVLGEVEGEPHEKLFWRTGNYQVVLADGWKLQQSDPPGNDFLFNLAVDPTEQNNLATQEPERVAALRALLEAHNREQVPPSWPSLLKSPINIDKTGDQPDAPSDDYIYWYN